ncbi:hypothetical protein V8E36_004273 [Tilletia maclaganii]
MTGARNQRQAPASSSATPAAATSAPSPTAFRVHLTYFASPSTPTHSSPSPSPSASPRKAPANIFDRLPAHDENIEEYLLSGPDEQLRHRIRKEPVHVDQRFGAITLDWADNESLHAIEAEAMASLSPLAQHSARSRPPHARTPAHLLSPQSQQQLASVQSNSAAALAASRPQVDSSGRLLASTAPSVASASGSSSFITNAAAAAAAASSSQSINVFPEAPVPVAHYIQQSTFSADDLDDGALESDRRAAVTTQASSSTYSLGRTHVAFGIVHLFRDQSEVNQLLAADKEAHFPSLSGTHATPAASTSLSSPYSSSRRRKNAAAPKGPPPGAVQVTRDEETGSILGILAVPSYMTAADFLAFIEPAADAISQIRMIRESQTEKCMVLIKFRDPSDAEEFHKMFNGQAFNEINEDERCQVVYITQVTVSASYTLPHAYPLLANSDPWPMLPLSSSTSPPPNGVLPASSGSSSGPGASTAPGGVGGGKEQLAAQLTYELPTCPVCLERMDSNVTGLMTVTCQHTFHCSCLSKWTDSRCPVCRYSQTRQQAGTLGAIAASAQSRCTICVTSSDLWVCLICASVGCGRYKAGHAQQHFQETGHMYSLELETQRVWDYAGDGYVHRLIQNKADGKLVELPPASSTTSAPGRRAYHSAGPEDTSTAGWVGKGSAAAAATASSSGSRGTAMQSRPTDPPQNGAEVEDKVESLGLEYSYLIVSQLESQRAFYEEQVKAAQAKVEASQLAQAQISEQLARTEAALSSLHARISELEAKGTTLASERERADKRTEKAMELMRKHERDLHTERAQSAGLMKNLASQRAERDELLGVVGQLKAELERAKEEMRDLMFFVSARDQIERDEELAGGDVSAPPLPPASSQQAGGAGAGAAAGAKKNKKKKKAAAPSAAVVAQLAAAAQRGKAEEQVPRPSKEGAEGSSSSRGAEQ